MNLSQAKMAQLLGRSLTSLETSNYSLYLKIAVQKLEELLCMNLTIGDGEREYDTRIGYKTLYVDPFTEITSLSVDGDEVDADDYYVSQNDKRNAHWYNTIVFDTVQTGEVVTIDADWGFGDSCPTDLELLLARLFAQNSVEQTADNQVKSKKIEDFTVTYKDNSTLEQVVAANSGVISKYSICNQGYIRHGRVRPFYHY